MKLKQIPGELDSNKALLLSPRQCWAGETVQWVRELDAFGEVLSFVLSTHMEAHNYL